MSSIFAFQVAEPILVEPVQASVDYDEQTQLAVWHSDNDAALVQLRCTGYPAGIYISCVDIWRFGCAPTGLNPGSGYGYRCDPT
jgi:hypothetical protein